MKNYQFNICWSIVFLLTACGNQSGNNNSMISDTANALPPEASSYSCGFNCKHPQVTYALPTEACSLGQNEMNCFAWSNFLAP